MMTPTSNHAANFGGLLLPLDMFRITQLAALFGEVLISKARNVLDAKLVVTRHATMPLATLRIVGSVIENDEATFWRDNAELAAVVSQALPRQVFLYYSAPAPARREGFLVAQGGQVLAGEDVTPDRLPSGATDAEWPLARLCAQLRMSRDDLANGFTGGPSVEVSLTDTLGQDDEALLRHLFEPEAAAEVAASGQAAPPSSDAPRAPAAPTAAQHAAEDAKRRAQEQAAEQAEQAARAVAVGAQLRMIVDDLGAIVLPQATLDEPEILKSYVMARIEGDVPPGVPRAEVSTLIGKRLDIAVPVEFLSEVFVEKDPLNRAMWNDLAQPVQLGGHSLKALDVLAPRVGYGTLLSDGKKHAFVSRKRDMPISADVVAALFG